MSNVLYTVGTGDYWAHIFPNLVPLEYCMLLGAGILTGETFRVSMDNKAPVNPWLSSPRMEDSHIGYLTTINDMTSRGYVEKKEGQARNVITRMNSAKGPNGEDWEQNFPEHAKYIGSALSSGYDPKKDPYFIALGQMAASVQEITEKHMYQTIYSAHDVMEPGTTTWVSKDVIADSGRAAYVVQANFKTADTKEKKAAAWEAFADEMMYLATRTGDGTNTFKKMKRMRNQIYVLIPDKWFYKVRDCAIAANAITNPTVGVGLATSDRSYNPLWMSEFTHNGIYYVEAKTEHLRTFGTAPDNGIETYMLIKNSFMYVIPAVPASDYYRGYKEDPRNPTSLLEYMQTLIPSEVTAKYNHYSDPITEAIKNDPRYGSMITRELEHAVPLTNMRLLMSETGHSTTSTEAFKVRTSFIGYGNGLRTQPHFIQAVHLKDTLMPTSSSLSSSGDGITTLTADAYPIHHAKQVLHDVKKRVEDYKKTGNTAYIPMPVFYTDDRRVVEAMGSRFKSGEVNLDINEGSLMRPVYESGERLEHRLYDAKDELEKHGYHVKHAHFVSPNNTLLANQGRDKERWLGVEKYSGQFVVFPDKLDARDYFNGTGTSETYDTGSKVISSDRKLRS